MWIYIVAIAWIIVGVFAWGICAIAGMADDRLEEWLKAQHDSEQGDDTHDGDYR